VADLCGDAPLHRSGRAVPVYQPQASGPLSIKLFFSYCDAICDSTTDARHSKGSRHEQTRNDANNVFRPSDSPLTEYEKEQIALRKNLERLKAERLAREAANSKND